MSSRVLRRLRQEKEEKLALEAAIDEEEDEESDDDDDDRNEKKGGFMFMMDDDSSSSDESSSDEDSDDGKGNKGGLKKSEDEMIAKKPAIEEEEEEEDLDALLSEFQVIGGGGGCGGSETGKDGTKTQFQKNLLLDGNNPRDYDLDYTLRSMLGGVDANPNDGWANNNPNNATRRNTRGGRGTRSNQRFLFAQAKEQWGRRPAALLGGGLGMKLQNDGSNDDSNETNYQAPYPYNNDEVFPYPQAWHTFDRSNTYSSKVGEYDNFISNTGDINALAMFVGDNPFIVEPLLQLSMFFFCTRDNEKGLDILKRILWIFEYACVPGFLPSLRNGDNGYTLVRKLMDHDSDENAAFFSTMFRFVQASCMVGCVDTSLAVSRFVLSLDPLRDPMGLLMTIDYFALATMKEKDLQFLIDLVESQTIQLYPESPEVDFCDLIEMPNWSFSYALALFRREQGNREEDCQDLLVSQSAINALEDAILKFPYIPSLLLEKNKVNTTGRSFQMDWQSTLGRLRELPNAKIEKYAAVHKIVNVFVDRSHKLWAGDDVVKFIHDACTSVIRTLDSTELESIQQYEEPTVLQRYMKYDPVDFQDSFRHIPADANPLDPGLVNVALEFRPNGRRMLNRRRMGQMDGADLGQENIGEQELGAMLGTGRGGMTVVDPDEPLAQLFLQTLMPSVRVDGVPPAQR